MPSMRCLSSSRVNRWKEHLFLHKDVASLLTRIGIPDLPYLLIRCTSFYGQAWEVKVNDGSDDADSSGRERITLPLDKDTLERLRSLGPGWQDRLNEILRDALDESVDD